MSIYSDLAPWYDQLFPVGVAQSDWLLGQLHASSARRVLDAGCGTGRHLEILASEGFEIAGFEPEEDMLEAARHRLEGQGDLRRLFLHEAREMPGNSFDALICLGNTLAHLKDSESLAAGLAALAAVCRPGGIFISQLVHFEKVLRDGRDSFKDRKLEDAYTFSRRYDFANAPEILRFSLSFSGPGVEFHEALSLHPWTLDELEPAFEDAGFGISEVIGDWTGAKRNPNSPATILLAHRR
jgi:SAM-dependent methyltransferase